MAVYTPPFYGQPFGGYGVPQIPQPVPQMMQQPVQQTGATQGINWVLGIAGATAYPVAPGNTVPLWDSENQVIYLKSADNTGKQSMDIIDYTIRPKNGKPVPIQSAEADKYATVQQYQELLERVAKLEGVKRDEPTV